MDLGGWLRSLGLDRYEAVFRASAIDADVLCDLTDQDLEELGVLLGHRRKLLRAIAALDDTLAPAIPPHATPSPTARDQKPTAATLETHFEAPASGEGGHVTVMFCGLVLQAVLHRTAMPRNGTAWLAFPPRSLHCGHGMGWQSCREARRWPHCAFRVFHAGKRPGTCDKCGTCDPAICR